MLPVIILRNTVPKSRWGVCTYLTEAHKAQKLWDERLNSKIFEKIKMEDFYFEMDRKFNREKRGSHIDMDIFANAVTSVTQCDPLEDLLHRFRRTPQSFKTLPSTHHAVVRAYLSLGKTEELLRMLDDRLNFGLFLDPYSTILLLDSFLVDKNYRSAAKVASHIMLQEEIDQEFALARSMAIYGALKYALTDINDQKTIPWDPIQYSEKKEPEEEIKIRVEYLDPVYNDDHFDLIKGDDIVGKTLMFLGKNSNDDILKNSLIVLACALRGQNIPESGPVSSCISKRLQELLEDEIFSNLKFEEFDIFQYLDQCIVQDLESLHFDLKLKELYIKWDSVRENELRKQYDSYMREHRLDEIGRKKKLLQEKEETLFFFDNVKKMDLLKEEKFLEWRKKLPRKSDKPIKLKPKQAVAQDYEPPKII
uniref:Mitochondrial 28S ribosomal protein S27 n=1 Tax=Lepeophtheirus salmonis TaxID=72036 RepID=C1BS94_LEPSM|nr:Mitochondrial 28S ribosomal protein S27 [Lepeophtheirus salmonis]